MFACLLFLVFGDARAKTASAVETEGGVVGASVSHPAKWFVEREPYTYDDTYGFTLWKPESGLPHDHGGTPAVRIALAYNLRPGQIEAAVRDKLAAYPDLEIVGFRHGYFDHSAGSPENEAVVEEINAAAPDILLVGLGMPLQERWLMENWQRLDVRVALTGGAVFDYVSGRLRRGPRLLTDNGFEWLARLLVEPRRLWRRYLIGNPLFLLRVLKQRLG